MPPAKKKLTNPVPPVGSGHNIFVGLAFELIGVALLAVFADLNDKLGELMVVLMVGWFIVFLSINSPWLQNVVPGAKGATASIGKYASGLAGPYQIYSK